MTGDALAQGAKKVLGVHCANRYFEVFMDEQGEPRCYIENQRQDPSRCSASPSSIFFTMTARRDVTGGTLSINLDNMTWNQSLHFKEQRNGKTVSRPERTEGRCSVIGRDLRPDNWK